MDKDFIKIIEKNIDKIKNKDDLNDLFVKYQEYKQTKPKQWDFNLNDDKEKNEIKSENKLENNKEQESELLKTNSNNEEKQKEELIKKKIIENNFLNNFKKTDNKDMETLKKETFILNG